MRLIRVFARLWLRFWRAVRFCLILRRPWRVAWIKAAQS